MAQRDAGSLNEYIDPSNDPVPAGYGLAPLATLPTPEQAQAMPSGTPPGFEHARSPILLTPQERTAYPEPPPGYKPGPMAPVRHAYEDSTLYKLGSVLASYGEDVPVNIKIKMAQQDADLKQQESKLGWDNYYRNIELSRELSKQHNREAGEQFMKLLPQMKAEITSMYGAPPEEQEKYVTHFARLADSLQPGGGDLLRFFHKNQSIVYAGDDIASNPDTSISAPAQEQIARMGYSNWLQTKEHAQLHAQVGRDYVSTTAYQFPKPIKDQMVAGTYSESDFRTLLKETGFKRGMRPISVQTMISFLDTSDGQNLMTHLGVATDAMASKKEGKEKATDPIAAAKIEEFEHNKLVLDDHAKNKGKYTDVYINDIKHRQDVFLGQSAKDTSPSASPNIDAAQRIQIASKGKYSTIEAAMQEPDPAKQPQAWKWAAQAREEADLARPQSTQDVSLAGPGDTSNYIDLNILREKGIASGVKGEVSKRELLTNKRYGKATPDQKKQLSELNIAAASANDVFDLANKAFGGNAVAEAIADKALSAEDTLLNAGPKALLKSQYPALAAYVARRESTLGKFARSISGEVGVLTDQDVVRVRNIFAIGGDTAQIRTAKKKALNSLIILNRKFAVEVLAGEMLPEEAAALKNSQQYRNSVNGIFGSVEGLALNNQSSSANPAENKDKRSRAERLADEMRSH